MKKVVLGAIVCAMAFSSEVYAGECHPLDGIYLGLGVGGNFFKISDEVTGYDNDTEIRNGNYNANRFMGSVVIGGGKVVNKIYGGIEVLFDIMKNKKMEIEGIGNVQMKGFVPQINIKAGYSFQDNIVTYGKLGCAWSKASYYKTATNNTSNKSKNSFVLGLGAEKAFSKNFSTALDVDYNFGFKKNDTTYNRGINVRILMKYNIKY